MATKRRRNRNQEADSIKDNEATKPASGGNYFTKPSESMDFIPSGCTLLDCVLGGGWPLGLISNVVGDKSTGKTLVAIEAAANFAAKFDGDIHYAEAEAAFDQEYARALGMPVDNINFPEEIFTVEDLFEYTGNLLEERDSDKPGLLIVDSLDAMSDRSELERDMDEGTYGANKAKKMSELFRRIVRPVEKNNMHIMFISQIRDRMNPGFGQKYTRSGGRALDFYASQIMYLAHLGQVQKTRKGIKRTTGVDVRAKCTKNKVAFPFRECDFRISFGYGVDDLASNLDWLTSTKNLGEIGMTEKDAKAAKRTSMTMPDDDFEELSQKTKDAVQKLWYEAEEDFVPKRSKY